MAPTSVDSGKKPARSGSRPARRPPPRPQPRFPIPESSDDYSWVPQSSLLEGPFSSMSLDDGTPTHDTMPADVQNTSQLHTPPATAMTSGSTTGTQLPPKPANQHIPFIQEVEPAQPQLPPNTSINLITVLRRAGLFFVISFFIVFGFIVGPPMLSAEPTSTSATILNTIGNFSLNTTHGEKASWKLHVTSVGAKVGAITDWHQHLDQQLINTPSAERPLLLTEIGQNVVSQMANLSLQIQTVWGTEPNTQEPASNDVTRLSFGYIDTEEKLSDPLWSLLIDVALYWNDYFASIDPQSPFLIWWQSRILNLTDGFVTSYSPPITWSRLILDRLKAFGDDLQNATASSPALALQQVPRTAAQIQCIREEARWLYHRAVISGLSINDSKGVRNATQEVIEWSDVTLYHLKRWTEEGWLILFMRLGGESVYERMVYRQRETEREIWRKWKAGSKERKEFLVWKGAVEEAMWAIVDAMRD